MKLYPFFSHSLLNKNKTNLHPLRPQSSFSNPAATTHRLFLELETELVHPLCQVRQLCENDHQREVKVTIKAACAEVLAAVRPEADLNKIRFKDWQPKVLAREQGLFYGLVSIIPLCLDRLVTIDLSVDEYINDFPNIDSK